VLLLDEGQPFTLVDAWFPGWIVESCPRLSGEAPLMEGTTRYIQAETGAVPARGKDVEEVRLAGEREARHLHLTLPCAVMTVLHTAWDERERPLVCEYGVTPGDLWDRTEEYRMGEKQPTPLTGLL
jgi:GntR family transcriptional regulator